ncbi:MAG TPA: hypothetical protein DDY98_09045 [Ruminococcaceae bacterium]|nr:hypothetical protein [Oscillospiraceae bacterium]
MKTPEEFAEKAKKLFLEGYNCSQAVLLAFEDITNLDTKTAAMLSSSFGGGMGRLREVCGAVSGMFMVAGLTQGYYDPKAKEEKTAHYLPIQSLAEEFKKENRTIICRELTGLNADGSAVPAERTAEYYKKRPCVDLVGDAARITAKFLQNQQYRQKD